MTRSVPFALLSLLASLPVACAGGGATTGRGGPDGGAADSSSGTGGKGQTSTGGKAGAGGGVATGGTGGAIGGGGGVGAGGGNGNGGKGGNGGQGGAAGNADAAGASGGSAGSAGTGGIGGVAGVDGSAGAGGTAEAGGGNTCGSTGALAFQSTIGGPGHQYGGDVIADPDGNAFVTGYYFGTITIGAATYDAGDNTEAWLMKTDPAGTPLWSKSLGDGPTGRFGQTAGMVAAHLDGSVTLVGAHQGTLDAGGGSLVSTGGYHPFVVKYDKDGTHVFSKTFGDNVSLNGGATAKAVAVDANGASILVGMFDGTASFGGAPFTSPSGNAAYVVKLDASGTHVFSKAFGQDYGVQLSGVAADASGNVIAVGSFSQPVDFGGGTLTPPPGEAAFLVKFDPTGAYLAQRAWGACAGARHVAVASNGDLVLTGRLYNTIDLGGGLLLGQGKNKTWVSRLTSTLDHVWSKTFLGLDVQRMRLDPCDDVLLACILNETSNLGGGDLVTVSNWGNAYAKLGPDGSHVWSRATSTTATSVGASVGIAADASSNVWLVGYFGPTASFGGAELVSTGSDAFLVKLTP